MEIYVKTQTKENPPKEIIDRTVQEIYSNTKHGDFGGFTPETISRIVFFGKKMTSGTIIGSRKISFTSLLNELGA